MWCKQPERGIKSDKVKNVGFFFRTCSKFAKVLKGSLSNAVNCLKKNFSGFAFELNNIEA